MPITKHEERLARELTVQALEVYAQRVLNRPATDGPKEISLYLYQQAAEIRKAGRR